MSELPGGYEGRAETGAIIEEEHVWSERPPETLLSRIRWSGLPREPGTLVEVEWWDSERVNLGWASRDDYLVALGDRSVYRTAGYVVGEDEASVMVSHSRSDSGNYSDAMLIPRAAIKAMRTLSPVS